MNYEQFKDFVSTLGFPIACATALVWIIYKLGKMLITSHAAHLEHNTREMVKQTEVLERIKERMPYICQNPRPPELSRPIRPDDHSAG